MGALARFAPGRCGLGDHPLCQLRHPALCRSTWFVGAAALTFTTSLAVVPLLAITLGVFSAFPAFAALRGYFEEALFADLVPQVGEQARLYLASFVRNTAKLTAVGMVALAVSAVMLLMTV